MATRKHNMRRWVRLLSGVLVPLLVGAAATFGMAAWQSLSVETGPAAWEREAYGWLLLRRPSRTADPRIVMVAVDTPRYENVEATYLEPQPGKRAGPGALPAPGL